MNPHVFLVGCPRSGTTLLSRIANAHPELAIVHETRWIPRTFEFRRGLTPDGFITPKLLDRMRDPLRLKRLAIDEEELGRMFENRERVSFATFVTELFDRYGEHQGKAIVGDKSPGYVRYLPLLHELWPEAKFVHIVRDGRDVSLSVLEWRKGVTSYSTFEEDPYTTLGVWWEWYVQLGREGGEHVGAGLYHELRYESLIAEPERESVELCDFLDIPYDASMLRFHEGRTRSKPGLSAKHAWLPITGGLRDWRTTMEAEGLLRFESAAGDLLEELGYPRGKSSVPRAARARAASATVHIAELGTTLASGMSHRRFGNIDWRTVKGVGLTGAVGAFLGAVVLSSISAELAEPWMAAVLLVLGVYILCRFTLGAPPRLKARSGVRGPWA